MASYDNLWQLQGVKVHANGKIYLLGATEFVTQSNDEIKHLALWSEEDWKAEQPPSVLIRDRDDEFPEELIRAYSQSIESSRVTPVSE